MQVRNVTMQDQIDELKKDVLDHTTSISTILRKAKIVASSLQNDEILSFVDKELNGYEVTDDLPEYRRLSGKLICRESGCFREVSFEDSERNEFVKHKSIYDKISRIEALIAIPNEQVVAIPLNRAFLEKMKNDSNLNIDSLFFLPDSTSLSGVIDGIRNRLIDLIVQQEQGLPVSTNIRLLSGFRHIEVYLEDEKKWEEFHFNETQAKIIQALYEAPGRELHKKTLLEQLGLISESMRIDKYFRNHSNWQMILKPIKPKGYWRLCI